MDEHDCWLQKCQKKDQVKRAAETTKDGETVMTFQRAQGQSLDKCRILLNRSVWTHGLLYSLSLNFASLYIT